MSNYNPHSTNTASSRFRRSSNKPYVQPEPSPIEVLFWEQAKPLIPDLQREVWIKHYRVDFLIPSQKIIIELYGYEYHSSKDQFTKDRKRERFLQEQGYHLISFSGREINNDVRVCAQEVLEYCHKLSAEAHIETATAARPAPPLNYTSEQQKTPVQVASQPQIFQPRSSSVPIADHSPLPFNRPSGLSQRLMRNQISPQSQSEKKSQPFGLRPQQLRIVIGFFVFDLVVIGTGLVLALR